MDTHDSLRVGEACEETSGESGPLRAVSRRASSSRGCSSSSLASSLPVSLVTTTTGTGGVWTLDASLSDSLQVEGNSATAISHPHDDKLFSIRVLYTTELALQAGLKA